MGKKKYTRNSISMGLLMLLSLCIISSCALKKNTPTTRFYHAMTAHYNTLYNGEVAFLEGEEAQMKSHQDDYNRLLPMYISTNKTTANVGKGNYETTITKCEKAIKLHSMKKRPTVKPSQKKDEKLKAFLARKEFNPYMYHAWLMMAEAQFQKGEFIEAASTYNYIIRLYSTQPEIASIAKAKLARCYVALDWAYDAEDVLNKMKRDSISRQGQKEMTNTMAAYHILTGQYEEAISYLKKAIKDTKRKLKKTRMNFLLGQLYQQTGHNEEAYKAYAKVMRANPPYEMAFSARISQTEVMPRDKFNQMISLLKRMAKSDKNKDYLDKVYYALGNIYMGVNDTTHCIYAWEKGVKDGTKKGPDKAMLLLKLSNLYWEMEKYIDAARTYKECVSILDKEHEEFKESERRSKILTELEPHLSAVKLQDSLQALAKLPEAEYLAAIDRVIAELKKQEKEAEKKAAMNGTNANGQRPANNGQLPQTNKPIAVNTGMNNQQQGPWYFYNPTTLKRGLEEFQRRWGQRKNEDLWRISNKASYAAATGNEDMNFSQETGGDDDSLYGAAIPDSIDSEEQAKKDSLANDPHHREYYLKQIPFTEEQMEASNAILSDGLYNAGILEQEKLENWLLAEKTMQRVLTDFPERDGIDNIYYHLFLLYGRLGESEKAEYYKALLLEQFADTKLAALLANPNYEMIARDGKHVEDSVYAASYNAYQASDYTEVEKNYQFSTENFPNGQNRARMMFIRAMSQLYGGERDTFLVTLKEVVQKYPKEEVTEIANAIVKGLADGRLLMDDRYDASSIWGRRNRQAAGDSTEVAPELKDDRYSNFVFVLAYPTNSLDENQLLFEMARYNFTSYMVRNFDLEIQEKQGITMMCVKGFLSYDEVHSYAQTLYADKHMNTLLEGIRTLLISEDNLKMIGNEFSFDDYKAFYEETFAPMEIPEDLQIDEPTNLKIIDPDDYVPEEKKEDEEEEEEEDFPWGF
jgi:tetratricopeptide (TPR) repeat protein